MGVSGLRVVTRPHRHTAVAGELARLPGVEVCGGDAGRGVLVVIQEQDSVKAHAATLRRIQELPGVLSAELVCHFAADDAATEPAKQRRS